MNMAESAALALAARERGWQQAQAAEEADLILLNTCSVRATAEQRVRGRLAHYAALKKKRLAGQLACGPFALVMAGCMAQRLGEKLKEEYPALDYVMGTFARSRFPLVLETLERGGAGELGSLVETDEKPEFSFSSLHFDGAEGGAEGNPFRGFVPIMHGCNNYCSYCIVPYVRGREVSRDPQAILEEIRLVGQKGVREITLLGQNVNSYKWEARAKSEEVGGKGKGLDFPGLLELIAENIESFGGVSWIRFLSSHPKDFSDDLITVMAKNPCFCRHIHLCVQHGSDRILKAMNRRYSRRQYLELVARLRSAMPGISLSTDILVGFPGENEEDLEETLELMDEVRFLYAYMYHFNPREGTAAYSLPGRVAEDIKRKRLARVIALQKRHTTELLKSRIGKDARVLIEGISRKNADELISRTERDEMVVIGGLAGNNTRAIGSFGKLCLSSLRGNTFRSGAVELLDNPIQE